MKWPYIKLPGSADPTLRPLVEVTLATKRKITPELLFLLDSGSDYTYADYSIGLWLGINFSKVNKVKSIAANNKPFYSYPAITNLEIKGHKVRMLIHYTQEFGGMGLLGQESVFDKFKIIFERYNWSFQIRPYK